MRRANGGVAWRGRLAGLLLGASLLAGCGGGDTSSLSANTAQSCMLCHNGSLQDNYGGPGIENPHPFGAAANLQCTQCHGGNPNGVDKLTSHVPPPPQIGTRADWNSDRHAYFNRLTLTGIDRFADYTVDGQTYSAIDYLQFINPGDLRVVTQGRSCGVCHSNHADVVEQSMLATSAGLFSSATYAVGVDSVVPESDGDYASTAADLGFRAVSDPTFPAVPDFGDVPRLAEFPVFSVRNDPSPLAIHNNPIYDAAQLADDRNAANQAITDSPLANLMHEQVAFTCGDCHLGSAGANNRSGDYRSSGCSACHMPYSLGGRSGSSDANINKLEPLDPDDIDPPELAHARSHRIMSVSKTLPNGHTVEGIDDYACAGCHQGSNRTVMQYWGIRLDQNEDVRRNRQYPANPDSFVRTTNDTRLFDPVVGNHEFNGRDHDQYLLFEDYDGDSRDDTPPDIHYEAGLGCIDCHGSYDLHGGDVDDPAGEHLASRMEHGVAIRCESCHGTTAATAQTVMGTAHDGQLRELAVDAKGKTLPHVVREADGHFYLYSKLTGAQHFVPQTHDVVVDNSVTDPVTAQPVYSPKASYAMGTFDGSATTGIGPQQTADGGVPTGFTHAANMDCASCHASWTNTCMGCHLVGEYTNNQNTFSNITGQRIAFRERDAEFVYQSPLFFQLGVDASNKITQVSPNTKMFFTWRDRTGTFSDVYTFSDRHGQGNDPAVTAPSLSHNAMMAHSIRGRVDANNEGPRYCVACHLTDDAINNYGAEYTAFVTALETNDFDALDQPPLGYALLQQHFGRNTGNDMNSPLWVHMVAGLGSGLFLFDDDGCPVNPLDGDTQRAGCGGQAPNATAFSAARVAFNLDRMVLKTGVATGSSNHALITPLSGPNLRLGAADPALAGPLGSDLIELLADPVNGLVLDSWLDADGASHGLATTLVGP